MELEAFQPLRGEARDRLFEEEGKE